MSLGKGRGKQPSKCCGPECAEAAKPEWWNDEELKALSARVVRLAPNEIGPLIMRGDVLAGQGGDAWASSADLRASRLLRVRTGADFKEAAACFDRAAALTHAPAVKADYASTAGACRASAEYILANPNFNWAKYIAAAEAANEGDRVSPEASLSQQLPQAAEEQARFAARSSDKYVKVLAEGLRYESKQDYRRAATAYRVAIALEPYRPAPYFNLANALNASGHQEEAAQSYLEAKERFLVGSEPWAQATARAIIQLAHDGCREVAKPEWWNDEGLKALSARVVRIAPNDEVANSMQGLVLSGKWDAWEAGPRSAAELKKAATHYDRAAALCAAPAISDSYARNAGWCRNQAATMCGSCAVRTCLLPGRNRAATTGCACQCGAPVV